MAITVTHPFVSPKSDGGDATVVKPSDWNAAHTVSGTVPVSQGGTGQTTEAEALGEMIQALTADGSPDLANDYLVTYDASADTGKKVLLNAVGVATPVPVSSGGTGQTTEAEALGEMIQALTTDASPVSSADYVATYDASADTGKKVLIDDLLASVTGRVPLTANTTFYVRTAPQSATVTIATPGVVTATAHGLSVNDPVVFTIPHKRKACTISSANPGVVTCSSHGFAIGDPILFRTTGALPTNLPARKTAGVWIGQDQWAYNTYWIIATDFGANSFKVATTAGGSAIDTSAGAQSGSHTVEQTRRVFVGNATFTQGAPGVVNLTGHGLAAGTLVVFNMLASDSIGGSGSVLLERPWDAAYYVMTTGLTANTFQVSGVDPSGPAVTFASPAGAQTWYVYRYQSLPNGIREGQTYYVKTVPTADTFTFAETEGGTAVNTTQSLLGSMMISTGNDSNNGSAATRTGAFLSLQACYNYIIDTYDFDNYDVTIQLAGGSYLDTGQLVTTSPGSWQGGGSLTIQGTSSPLTFLEMTGGNGDLFLLNATLTGPLVFSTFESFNTDFATCNLASTGNQGSVVFSDVTLAGWAMEDPHFLMQGGSRATFNGTINILTGVGRSDRENPVFVLINEQSRVYNQFPTINLYDSPTFPEGMYKVYDGGYLWNNATTFNGTYGGSQGIINGPTATVYHWVSGGNGPIPGTDFEQTNLGSFFHDDRGTPANSYSLLGSSTAIAFTLLPSSPAEGMMVPITDSNTATWGATIAGGGANHVLGYYNGTNWTVAAK